MGWGSSVAKFFGAVASPVTGIIGAIAGPMDTYLEHRNELKMAEHQRNLAIIGNQARLAQSKADHNSSWEMASLQDKDKFLRIFSYIFFTFPIAVVMFAPEYGNAMILRLETIPEWLLKIEFYMISGVWGIASLKDAVPSIVSSFRKKK